MSAFDDCPRGGFTFDLCKRYASFNSNTFIYFVGMRNNLVKKLSFIPGSSFSFLMFSQKCVDGSEQCVGISAEEGQENRHYHCRNNFQGILFRTPASISLWSHSSFRMAWSSVRTLARRRDPSSLIKIAKKSIILRRIFSAAVLVPRPIVKTWQVGGTYFVTWHSIWSGFISQKWWAQTWLCIAWILDANAVWRQL